MRGHGNFEFFDQISSQKQKVCKTVFACSYETCVESLKQKNNGGKSRDTVPLKWQSGIILLWVTKIDTIETH